MVTRSRLVPGHEMVLESLEYQCLNTTLCCASAEAASVNAALVYPRHVSTQPQTNKMQLLAFPQSVQCCRPHGLQTRHFISSVRVVTKRFRTKRAPNQEPYAFATTTNTITTTKKTTTTKSTYIINLFILLI